MLDFDRIPRSSEFLQSIKRLGHFGNLDWLGLRLDEPKALEVVSGKRGKKKKVGWFDTWVINREASATMAKLGYRV